MFIKVIQGTSTRKFKLDDKATLSQLRKELQRIIGEDVNKVNISYTDSDSEVITVLSEEDWSVCVEEFTAKNKDKPVLTVTIQVSEAIQVSKTDISSQSFCQSQTEVVDIKEEPKPESQVAPQEKVIEELVPEPQVESAPKETKPEEVQTKSVFEDETPAEPQLTEKPAEPQVPQEDQYLSCFLNVDGLGDLSSFLNNLNNLMPGVEVVKAELIPEQKATETMDESLAQSTLTVDMKKEIESLVDQRVSQILSSRNIPTTPAPSTEQFVHHGIFCDGCKSRIVDQPRYKSLVIPDYDLCETCERKGIHVGPMVKFPKPSAHSASRLNSFFRENLHEFFGADMAAPQRPVPEPHHHGFQHPWARFPRRRSWIGGNRCPYFANRDESARTEASPRRDSARPSFCSTMTDSNTHAHQRQPNTDRPASFNLEHLFRNARLPENLRNVAQNVAPQLLNHLTRLTQRHSTPAQQPAQAAPAPAPRDPVEDLINSAEEVLGAVDRHFLRDFIIRNNITTVESLVENLY